MNGMDNFYRSITSPEKSYPAISQDGISAFLVHRLAKDFRAACGFTAESGKSIKTRVSGAIYSNHLGAVDLEIEAVAPGQFELARKPFTIWQNDTDSLYTLMAIPAEETLHYLLGRATDREILTHFQATVPELNQYRYRKQGLQLAADLGFRPAMDLYPDSPSRFRERLL